MSKTLRPVGQKALCPEQTQYEYISDGCVYKAKYAYTHSNGEYMFEISEKLGTKNYRVLGFTTESRILKGLNDGEFDEVVEVAQ